MCLSEQGGFGPGDCGMARVQDYLQLTNTNKQGCCSGRKHRGPSAMFTAAHATDDLILKPITRCRGHTPIMCTVTVRGTTSTHSVHIIHQWSKRLLQISMRFFFMSSYLSHTEHRPNPYIIIQFNIISISANLYFSHLISSTQSMCSL